MKTKKIPMRMCVVTREKLPKQELIRVVNFEGKTFVDVTGKHNGNYLNPNNFSVEFNKVYANINSTKFNLQS